VTTSKADQGVSWAIPVWSNVYSSISYLHLTIILFPIMVYLLSSPFT
jgi:hypothetical protein